jgi:hypothetical protein
VPHIVGDEHRGGGEVGVPEPRVGPHVLLSVPAEPLAHLGDSLGGDVQAVVLKGGPGGEIVVRSPRVLGVRKAARQVPERERPTPVDQHPVVEPAHADTLGLQSP